MAGWAATGLARQQGEWTMDLFGDKGGSRGEESVIDMASRQSQQRFAPLAQIEAYWDALRGSRLMPLRSEIDPRGLKGTLEYCFVLERIAPGLARMRVAGAHLADLMGMEVRGVPISSFLTSGSRQKFGEMLEEVFETPAVARVTMTAEIGFSRPPLKAGIVLMPVRSDLGDTSRILGGLVTDGEIGRAPRRFTVTAITLNPIQGKDKPAPSTADRLQPDDFRIKRALRDLPAPKGSRVTEAAESGPEFEQPLPNAPYLRLVK